MTTRRAALGIGMLAAGGLLIRVDDAAAATAEDAKLDLNDPTTNMLLLAKLQGDLSGQQVWTHGVGKLFLIRAGAALPLDRYGVLLTRVESARTFRMRRRADGAIEDKQRVWQFYRDAKTGALVDEMVNPFTGKTVKSPPFRAGISGSVMTPNGPEMKANFPMESTVFNKPVQLDWQRLGDTMIVQRHAFTRWKEPSSGRFRTEMTLDTWRFPAALLADKESTRIDGQGSWVSQTEFQTWLEMGEEQGNSVWRNDFVRVSGPQDFPADFVAKSKTLQPDIFEAKLEFDT